MTNYAIAELMRLVDTYGDPTLGIKPGDLSKPRKDKSKGKHQR